MLTTPLSYSAFTLEHIHKNCGFAIQMQSLFNSVEPIKPSAFLQTALQRIEGLILSSEKARSEFLITPILLEVRDYLHSNINIYSGIRFDVAPEEGLQGICDFIISKSKPMPILQSPLLLMVEAKKNDIDAGLGQCAAEMMAATRFNHAEGLPDNVVYGCVTTGELWQFLSLSAKIIHIDPHHLYIGNIDKVLGMLVKMLA